MPMALLNHSVPLTGFCSSSCGRSPPLHHSCIQGCLRSAGGGREKQCLHHCAMHALTPPSSSTSNSRGPRAAAPSPKGCSRAGAETPTPSPAHVLGTSHSWWPGNPSASRCCQQSLLQGHSHPPSPCSHLCCPEWARGWGTQNTLVVSQQSPGRKKSEQN